MLLTSHAQIMPTKNPRVTAVLPQYLYNAIEDMAKTQERSMSQMTAILIREALQARGIAERIPTSGKP